MSASLLHIHSYKAPLSHLTSRRGKAAASNIKSLTSFNDRLSSLRDTKLLKDPAAKTMDSL